MFSPIWIRTRVLGFKVPSDNHYTIGERVYFIPYTRGMHGVGFEPTQLTLPGLKSGSLDHSDNRAYEHFKACSSLCSRAVSNRRPLLGSLKHLFLPYKNNALTN